MIAHPVLVERPILVVGAVGAVCRPPERATALLRL
jgi:arsenate reductase-like glutaredoxin family protein